MENRFGSLDPKRRRSPRRNNMLPEIPNRSKAYSKIIRPLIRRKQVRPWIPSGNSSHVYASKLAVRGS